MKHWLCWGGFVLALGGCTDAGGGDTDSETDGTSSGGTTMAPTVSGTTATTTTAGTSGTAPTSSSTTVDPDTGSTSDDSSSGDPGSSSSGGGEADVCAGFTALGAAAQVHGMGPLPDDSCDPAPAPCGGSPVGTWTVQTTCGYEVLPDFAEEICEGATQQITGSSVSGTRTLLEDGTFTSDVTITLDVDFQVDSMECAGLSCEAFADTLSMVDDIEMVCEDAKVGCNCVYELSLPETIEGTWDTLDDSLLITVDDNLEAVYEYCVGEDRMTVWLPLFTEEVFPETACEDDVDCDSQVDGNFDFLACIEPEEDEG